MNLDVIKALETLDYSALYDEHGNGHNTTLLIKSWSGLIDSSPIGTFKSIPMIRSFARKAISDIKSHIKFYAELSDKLVNSKVRDDFGDYVVSLHHDFRRTPVFREYDKWYRTGNPILYSYLLTFTGYGKKSDYFDPQFQSTAFRAWIENERSLKGIQFKAHILADMRDLLRLSGFDFSYDDVHFRHGPGSVSNKKVKGLAMKCDTMPFSATIEDNILSVIRKNGSPRVFDPLKDHKPWAQKFSVKPISRLFFARKNYKTARSVLMDETSHMYAQLGVNNAMVRAIEKCKLGQSIHIHDQSINRKACVDASYDLEFSTIDLEAASDLVHLDLVRALFPPKLLHLMEGCRTERVLLPDKTEHVLVKFAGMGNGLCFSTQCIIFTLFTALAEALQRRGIDVDDYISSDKQLSVDKYQSSSLVYGDDIICPTFQTRAIMSLLASCGFRVNLSKSFFGCRVYRESCGEEGIDGHVVSRLMMKIKEIGTFSATNVASTIDFCNRLFVAGYETCRQVIKNYLPRSLYVECSIDSPNRLLASHLYEHKPDNSDLRHRLIPGTGTSEYRVRALHVEVHDYSTNSFDSYMYNSWLQSSLNPFRDIRIKVQPGKPTRGIVDKPTLRWKWMPT